MKIVKQIMYQKELIDIINIDTEHEETIELVSEDRVIVRYVEGELSSLIKGNSLVETPDIDEPSVLIKKSDMSTGNPNSYDLSTVGSKELLEALLKNIENKLNTPT